MAEHAFGAGDLVDEIPRGGGLRGGENLSPLRFLSISRRSGLLSFDLDAGCGDIAQQPDGDLAVQINVLDELRNVGIAGINRKADKRRVPNAPALPQLIELPARVERIRFDSRRRCWPLRDGPEPRRGGLAPPDEMELIIEDEQVPGWGGRGVCRRFE